MNWNYSCKKVSELVSQSLDEPLGVIDRMRLRMHLSMCGNCQNVERQLTSLHCLISADRPDDEEGQDPPPRGKGDPSDAGA
jgi:hypothetical protein